MSQVKGYTEPKSLIEDDSAFGGKHNNFALLLVAVLFVISIVCAVRMGKLVPTYNGKVDVAALQQDPTDYNWDDADGAAYLIVAQNLDKTNAQNVCFSVVFNFRGYDTMGESFILIAALAGSLCILRNPVTAEEEEENKKKAKEAKAAAKAAKVTVAEAAALDDKERAESEEVPVRHAKSIIVRYSANLFLPLACTFGGYVVLHGDSSPGGGFQGGVLIAAAILLVFLGYGHKAYERFFGTDFLHASETIAELIYVVIGLVGVLVGLSFAYNFIISQLDIETALLMNHAVGYHVMAGIGCLLLALLGMMNIRPDEAVHVDNPGMEDQPLEPETAETKEESR